MSSRHVPRLFAAVLLAWAAQAQRVVLELRSVSAPGFGSSLAGVGDVDLDGWPDLLVGAPDAEQTAGRAELRSGRDGRILFVARGAAPDDRLGSGTGRLGDVDRDGHPDLLVTGRAQAVVYSGATGAVLLRVFAFRACGAGDADADGSADVAVGRASGMSKADEVAVVSGRTGFELAHFVVPADEVVLALDAAGDADGDGRDDLVLGIGRADGSVSRARVLSPARAAILWEWTSDPGFVLGQSAAGAGDVDGDGHADVVLGVHETASVPPLARSGGEVVVRSGRTGAVLQRVAGSLWTNRLMTTWIYFRQYGLAVAGGGDLDGDGTPDVLAHEAATLAPARIRSSTGLRITPAVGPFAFCGDVDRDGFDELAVGDPAQRLVRIVAGPAASALDETSWYGPPPGGLLRLRSVGDQNGDGVRDLLAARLGGDQVLGMVFQTAVLSGRDGASLGTVAGPSVYFYEASLNGLGDLDGDQREDWAVGWFGTVGGWVDVQRSQLGTLRLTDDARGFGVALAGGADWNGDGRNDVFVGVAETPGSAGAVQVRSGADGTLLSTLDGSGGGFGRALCMPGDVDGDRIGDLLVAAPEALGSGLLRMYGGAGTRVLWTAVSAAGELLALPDQDGDGAPDVALLVAGAGQIEIRSGRSGIPLRTLVLPGFSAASLDGGPDENGDGAADLVVGAPAQSRVRIVSSRDGATLLEHAGYPDGLGAGVGWIGTVDGALHAAASAAAGGTHFTGYVRRFRDGAGQARVVRYGHGCRTALPAPDLTLTTRPVLGTTPQLALRILAANTPTALVIGASDTSFGTIVLPYRLAVVGAPACVLWTSAEHVGAFTPTSTTLLVPWRLPNDPGLIGSRMFAQAVQLDPGGTVRTSAGLRVQLGR